MKKKIFCISLISALSVINAQAITKTVETTVHGEPVTVTDTTKHMIQDEGDGQYEAVTQKSVTVTGPNNSAEYNNDRSTKNESGTVVVTDDEKYLTTSTGQGVNKNTQTSATPSRTGDTVTVTRTSQAYNSNDEEVASTDHSKTVANQNKAEANLDNN